MAWFEKGHVVHVVELRGRTIWERIAKGPRAHRGRVRLAGEYLDETTAGEAYRERLLQLQAGGYQLVDATAGVDARLPRATAGSHNAGATTKVSIDEFLQLLRGALDRLPKEARLAHVLETLGAQMRSTKRGFRIRGYACDLGVRGSARFALMVASKENSWREIGYEAHLQVPDEHETEEERIECDTSSWKGFATLVRDDPAWRAVADLLCTSIEIVDDEID